MNSIFSYLNNPLTGIIFALLIGLFFYLKSKKKKDFSFQVDGYTMIGKEQNKLHDSVKIYFKDKLVSSLTKTVIILWNNGHYTINKADIIKKDKIRIELSANSEILNANLLTKTRDIINPVLIQKENKNNILYIEFDFLDHNDGFQIEIIHTDTQTSPKIKGTIKGIPKGISDKGYFTLNKGQTKFKKYIYRIMEHFLPIISLIIGLSFSIFGFLPTKILKEIDKYNPKFLYNIFFLEYFLFY